MTIVVVLATLFGAMVVGTIFVGPIFGFFMVAVAGGLYLLAHLLVNARGAGVAEARRPSTLRRLGMLIFLVAVILSVTMQGILYYDADACAAYDWLDNVIDGECRPYVAAIMEAESFFLPAQYYAQ